MQPKTHDTVLKNAKILSAVWLTLAGFSIATTALNVKSWEERPVSNFAVLAGYALVARRMSRNFSQIKQAIASPQPVDKAQTYRLQSAQDWNVAGLFATHVVQNLTAVPEIELTRAAVNTGIAGLMTAFAYRWKHKAEALEGTKPTASRPT